MSYTNADRVKEATSTTGTGTITLSGAATNFRTFSAAMAIGDSFTYCIEDNTNNAWEVGIGILATAGTITRDTVIASSNGGALVNFAAGTKTVFVTMSGTKGLRIPQTFSVAPSEGVLQLFNKPLAGRSMTAQIGASGLDTILQPHWGRNKIVTWNPAGNSTTITANGGAGLSATGAATTSNVATTNRYTIQRKLEYLVTTAATTAVAGFRSTTAMWTIGGTTAGAGGFTYVFRFAPATGVATSSKRLFVGMSSNTAAPTDVDPSTLTNSVGVGYNGSGNFKLYYRGAGASNSIDLGSSFPVPTVDRSTSYELAMFAIPGTTQKLGWQFTDLISDVTTSGVITTGLPAITTFLGPRGYCSAGGTSSVIGIALMNGYIESDY